MPSGPGTYGSKRGKTFTQAHKAAQKKVGT